MASFEPADNLRSRTFLGLLVAQFLAAFNDQAIHASAMFFAINQRDPDRGPGHLADADPLLRALGHLLHPGRLPRRPLTANATRWSSGSSPRSASPPSPCSASGWARSGSRLGPWIVLSTVFLMGMHSAFFVPAKYGAMPEILQPAHAVARQRPARIAVVPGGHPRHRLRRRAVVPCSAGRNTSSALILLGLAVVGAVASLLIQQDAGRQPRPAVPAVPLQAAVREHPASCCSRGRWPSRCIGIAFFTFIVAFMRATVYMHGESQVPRWTESKTSDDRRHGGPGHRPGQPAGRLPVRRQGRAGPGADRRRWA